MTTNNKISNLVYSQVPFFVKNDHPNFILFLEKYYEYLEQTGKTVERAKNLPNFDDIDLTEDQFAEKLYNQFLTYLPRDVVADKAILLKHAKEFYRSKGTENSIRFLLSALFNLDFIDFYYPKTDVLRASDGKWFIEKSIRVQDVVINNLNTNNLTDVEKFTSRQITGNTSGATAIVETISSYYDQNKIIYELRISNQTKDFISGETIFATYFDDNGVLRPIRANSFSGVVSSVRLISGGAGYSVGSIVPVESNTGTGATVVISDVTSGNLSGIFVNYSGAGFVNSNYVLVSGGGGSGANANVAVIADGKYHPNTYSIISSEIELEANTTLGSIAFANLNSANINTTIANAMNSFIISGVGYINRVYLLNSGSNYSSLPSLDAQANTRIRNLGILGRMEIVNGGINYQTGDSIEFINVIGGYGSGAAANVTNVAANGMITEVKFVEIPGQFIGGSGYSNDFLPIANVVSTTGSNANIIVKTILGDGETLTADTETIGTIRRLTLVSGGSGYQTEPTINLTGLGDGKAQASATIITGAFAYPGRFLNDDGMISSFNYLEDRDFYQNYSYVIRTGESFALYKKALKDLIHPGGMKVFGEYDFINEDIPKLTGGVKSESQTYKFVLKKGNYYTKGDANGSNVSINIPSHGFVANDNVYVEFITGSTANLANIQIAATGVNYANGYIAIQNGSGSGANASTITNATGHIVGTVIHDRGEIYSITDNLIANVAHLITYNVNTVSISNSSRGYSNGFVTFEGGSGRSANANITVNATGTIVGITIRNRGTGYAANDSVVANVASLISYNIAAVNVSSSGSGYSNGYVNFTGGLGFGANANVSVDAQGNITSIVVNDGGYGYRVTDVNFVRADVAHLKTYVVEKLLITYSGANYQNGYITLEGGTGSGANANITINPATGSIDYININSTGTGYSYGDSVYANVESLITNNIATIQIDNAGLGYSNGYISFEGGLGNYANAAVTVNGAGAIVSIDINDRGTKYASGDAVYANVESLLTYKANTITINDGGYSYSNGYIIFEGGSGRNANASVTVNSTGAITNVTFNDQGTGYIATENVVPKIAHLTSYIISNVMINHTGSGYSNGYISFEGGSGFGANARVYVNATGAIMNVAMLSNGTGYIVNDYSSGNVTANVVSLGGSNANLVSVLTFGNPTSANLTMDIVKYGNTSNLLVNLQKGSGNANIKVVLTGNGTTAVLPITLQKFSANANLNVTLQKGGGNANLILNLQPEPLNTITNSIFLVASSNTNWFTVQHPNTANIYGTSYAGIMI